MMVIGVTGTDGKTTTVHLIYEILKKAGKKVSMVSSVEAVISGKSYDTGFHVTTPNPPALQKFLYQAAQAGNEYFVLEVTSHGLDQHRVSGISIDVGLITNISHEHLDYHGNLEEYRNAKAKILRGVKYAILNADDHNYRYLTNQVDKNTKIVTFAIKRHADYTLTNLKFKTNLFGKFNLYNCLAAAVVGRVLKIDNRIINKAILEFKGITGRMEEINNKKGFRIFIDFAHKPNALESVLKSARGLTKGKIIVIFGIAGLRDKLKRPIMGEIAGRLADYTILTAEDPRTEDVRDIIGEIAYGCTKVKVKELNKRDNPNKYYKNKHKYFWRIADRQEAINFAIRKLARRGDLVLITGKGHEKSMCYGRIEYPWDEKRAIEKALYGTNKTSGAI